MELGTLEREIHIEASPDVVYAVVSQPEHMHQWWDVEAEFEPSVGGQGWLHWAEQHHHEPILVTEADPPRRFAFRWVADADAGLVAGRSLLVTFTLEPTGTGTMLRMVESGWREKGWEAAVLEQTFHDHERGWDSFVPRLAKHAEAAVSTR